MIWVRLGQRAVYVALLAGGLLRADVVTDWNAVFLNAVKIEDTAAPLAARDLAILHAAVFDAANAVVRGYEPYFVTVEAPSGALADVAAAAAAHEVAIVLFPSEGALFDDAFTAFLVRVPVGPARDQSIALGEYVADGILAWRLADGANLNVPYIPGTEPGDWRRTPPFYRPPDLPQWPYLVPFAMTNQTQFRPPGPPALSSARWAADFNQVKGLGSSASTNRTAEQTVIARFWSDFSYTVTPPGHWNLIAQDIVGGRTPSLIENARLFALINLAMADAGIVAWDAKYFYNFWRPVTAIREADTDGNPDTLSNTNWSPLLNTPSFPEYVSGHSTFSSAAATVLTQFYGTDQVSFTVGSDTLPGVVRSYDSLWSAAEECGMSRIYGGIHYLSSDLDALAAGQALGKYVYQQLLRPLPAQIGRPLLSTEGTVELKVLAPIGNEYVLEVSNDLQAWSSLATNRAPFTVDDVDAGTFPVRFYRAVPPR